MPATFSVLCVHGVGHGDQDATLKPAWTAAITQNLKRWQPNLTVDCQFLKYGDLFEYESQNGVVYGKALAQLPA